MIKRSFVVSRLKRNDARKSFVRAVNDGQNAEKNGSDCPKVLHPLSQRHRLPQLPKNYEWTIGETVALVAFTGAGMVPSSIYGTFQGFTRGSNGRKAAVVTWHREDALISGTVAIQRIRPIAFLSQ